MEEKDLILPNGLRVHYYEWPGPKPTLVFLHPSSGYGRMWEWTAKHLGSRFHVYAMDQRGHGATARPGSTRHLGRSIPWSPCRGPP